jgi:hypothetical protein
LVAKEGGRKMSDNDYEGAFEGMLHGSLRSRLENLFKTFWKEIVYLKDTRGLVLSFGVSIVVILVVVILIPLIIVIWLYDKLAAIFNRFSEKKTDSSEFERKEKTEARKRMFGEVMKVLFLVLVLVVFFFLIAIRQLGFAFICLCGGLFFWYIWEKFFTDHAGSSSNVTCCESLDQCTCDGGEMCDACRYYYNHINQ